MAKMHKDFYDSCVAMRSEDKFQRFFKSLTGFKDQVQDEYNLEDDHDNMLRLQGQIRLLNLILSEHDAAELTKRRIDGLKEKGTGPTPASMS